MPISKRIILAIYAQFGPTEKRGYGLMIAMRPWVYRNVVPGSD